MCTELKKNIVLHLEKKLGEYIKIEKIKCHY